MSFYIKRKDTNTPVLVRKYVRSNNGEESVWSDEWYGRHVIGQDCEWYNPKY